MVERCMRELINQEFMQLKSEIDRIANDTEFNGNRVLNGNISGKEYEVEEVNTTVTKATNGILDNDKLGKIMADVDGDSLRPLGEGTFELKISRATANGADTITLEIVDKLEFNGGKEYVMDSVTFAKPGNGDPQTVEIAGITLSLKGLENNTNIAANESATIEFSNTVRKEEEGIRLQVGANREQMIGLSVGNMRSRELGLGGIDVIGVGNAEEAIERIDEAISRVSSQRADLGAAQNRLEHTIASTDNTPEESIRYVGNKLYRDELDKNEILYVFWLIYFQLGYCLRNEYKFEKSIKYGL